MRKATWVSIWGLLLAGYTTWAQPTSAFVWADTVSDKRQEWVYFRREFTLPQRPTRGDLHLFVDARYVLTVNGQRLGSGPVRFYPSRIFYDTYDLTPHLRKGHNVIALQALSPGMQTFQTPRSQGGLTVGGSIQAGDSLVDLGDVSAWRCRRALAYALNTPKMTFALGAMEVHDARLEPDNWEAERVQPARWKAPVAVRHPQHWGHLSPRPIPFLTQQAVVPRQLRGVYPLRRDEALYSFRIKTHDRDREEAATRTPCLAYTQLYSPRAQNVQVGLWWGKYYLNGKEITAQGISKTRMQWQDYTLPLQAGWNTLLVKGEAMLGIWDFYFALPKKAQVTVNADAHLNGTVWFRTYQFAPTARDEWERYETATPPRDVSGWTAHTPLTPANNPVFEMAWQPWGPAQATAPKVNSPVVLTKPSALLYDFGHKQLGRLRITYDAPSGTRFDYGFSEDLLGDRAFILKRHLLYLGGQHVSSQPQGVFETFHPYGLRYLQLHVSPPKGKKATIRRVEVLTETYPFTQMGQFACSDTLLNAIWEMGWRTLRVCAEDTYVDTPFRERGVYAGDALPEYAITLATAPDSRLMKHTLQTLFGLYRHLFEPNQREHPDGLFGNLEDYPHLLLQGWHWYGLRTRDTAFIRHYYGGVRYFLDNALQQRSADGLYTNVAPAFIEWSAIEKKRAEHTFLQVVLAESCRIMAHWATEFGYDADAARYLKAHADIQRVVQTRCWDEALGTFHDGFKQGKPLGTAYAISGAVAVLYGIATPAQAERVIEYITRELVDIGQESRNQRASPYGSFYLLQALYQHQRADVAEAFVRKHWGKMVRKYQDTAWENFDDVAGGTLSHAWSAHPTYFLSTEALGVQLEYPRRGSLYDTVLIAPQAETLQWAKGVVPHPRGTIGVNWRVEGDQLHLSCEVPAGVPYRVVPRGRLANLELWVNGARYAAHAEPTPSDKEARETPPLPTRYGKE